MKFSVLVLVALVCLESIVCTRYKPCPGCEKSGQCLIHVNTDAKFEMGFVSTEKHKNVNIALYYKLGIMWASAPGYPKAACGEGGLPCPLEANQKYNYTATSHIYSYTPHWQVDIKMELVDKDNSHILGCAIVNVKVV